MAAASVTLRPMSVEPFHDAVEQLRAAFAAREQRTLLSIDDKAQRLATADVLCAILHHCFAQIATALNQDGGHRASVFDDVSGPVLRVDGCSITVRRFSLSDELSIEFYGLDHLLGRPREEFKIQPLSLADATALASQICEQIASLLAKHAQRTTV